MKIAIPLDEGRLTEHFGHCSEFAMLDVNIDTASILEDLRVPAPTHQPGLLPGWLADQGAELVIAGGLGDRARVLLEERGVQVIVGVAPDLPEELARRWCRGELGDGKNLCDH